MTGFDIDEIPSALQRHLPVGAELVWPAQGMTSEVALAVGTSGTVVLKRCTNPIYLTWLRREHEVLLAIAHLGLPVPNVIDHTEQSGSSGPEAWLVMSCLPGRSLWSAMLEAPDGERGPLLQRLGLFLRALHSARIPEALGQPKDWISRKLEQARANLDWCDGDEGLLRWLEESRPAPVPEVLIHGDPSLDNVLIDEGGVLSLIDWSGGDCGDPRYDIALALRTEPEITLGAHEVASFHSAHGGAPMDARTQRWFELLYEFS